MWIKISKGKRCMGWCPGEIRCKLSHILSQYSNTDALNSPSNDVWQHMKSVANQESSLELWCPVVLLRVKNTEMQCPHDWSQLLRFQPPQIKIDSHQKITLLTQTIWSNWCHVAQGLRYAKIFWSGRISWVQSSSPRGSPWPVPRTGLSWECAGFE